MTARTHNRWAAHDLAPARGTFDATWLMFPHRNQRTSVDTWLKDFAFGVRTLRKNPAFALTALVTLALGIGASTAIFSVVNAVLLKPLPYTQADRLVIVTSDMRNRKVTDFRGRAIHASDHLRHASSAQCPSSHRAVALTGRRHGGRSRSRPVELRLLAEAVWW